MFVSREDEGVWLRELPVWVVDTLLSVPDWIESDDPAVRRRLLPPAYEDDEEREKEWRAALGSSLEHLVSSRTQIVRTDLQKMVVAFPDGGEADDPEDEDDFVERTVFDVFIPAAHVSAWISTLQAGTHALFILAGLTAEDVEREADFGEGPDTEKQVAMLRLSALQEILVRLLD